MPARALAGGTEDQTPVAAAVRRCWDALAALEALAQEVDRWWYAPDADGGSFDLAEGVRLHRAVETHLGQLEAV